MQIDFTPKEMTDELMNTVVRNICNSCNSQSVKYGWSYASYVWRLSPLQREGWVFGDVGFYFLRVGIKHTRLIEFAISKNCQRNGFGKLMYEHLLQNARCKGIHKITLRTSKYEPAINFWEHMGAKVCGFKNDDYGLEINL